MPVITDARAILRTPEGGTVEYVIQMPWREAKRLLGEASTFEAKVEVCERLLAEHGGTSSAAAGNRAERRRVARLGLR